MEQPGIGSAMRAIRAAAHCRPPRPHRLAAFVFDDDPDTKGRRDDSGQIRTIRFHA
jgi:hypothetical protein